MPERRLHRPPSWRPQPAQEIRRDVFKLRGILPGDVRHLRKEQRAGGDWTDLGVQQHVVDLTASKISRADGLDALHRDSMMIHGQRRPGVCIQQELAGDTVHRTFHEWTLAHHHEWDAMLSPVRRISGATVWSGGLCDMTGVARRSKTDRPRGPARSPYWPW